MQLRTVLAWRLHTARLLLPGERRSKKLLIALTSVFLFIILSRFINRTPPSPAVRALTASLKEPPFNTAPRTLYSLDPPDLSALRATVGRRRTLYILPYSELRCTWQYNYFCKFYYAIRCYMLAGFERVVLLPSIHHLQKQVRVGDVALLPYRSKKHMETPSRLLEINEWRHAANATLAARTLRVGIFHVANEIERADWPWYTEADFVLRNYWLPTRTPPHVQYVPLGHQMPNTCIPESPLGDTNALRPQLTCSCGGRTFQPASKRKYLFTFSGSLRRGRSRLLRAVRGSRVLRGRGQILVSRKFGGDGVVGGGDLDPKVRHVRSMLESAFVFAPCGNVMETHRIYEALAMGAVPIIEDCEGAPTNEFFPFRELIAGTHQEMVAFVESFVDNPLALDRLQERVLRFWDSYARDIATNVTRTALVPVAGVFAP